MHKSSAYKINMQKIRNIRQNISIFIKFHIVYLQELQKCFESRDIALLQETISKMPEDQAKFHLKRCVDSGLWVPDASKVDKEEKDGESADGAEAGAAAAATTSISSDVKPNVTIDDID